MPAWRRRRHQCPPFLRRRVSHLAHVSRYAALFSLYRKRRLRAAESAAIVWFHLGPVKHGDTGDEATGGVRALKYARGGARGAASLNECVRFFSESSRAPHVERQRAGNLSAAMKAF